VAVGDAIEPSGGATVNTLDRTLIADLEVMVVANNYRGWMYKRLAPFIGDRILEVGAGIGNFTEMLLDREMIVATDKYQSCVDYLAKRLGGHLHVEARRLDLETPEGNLERFSFDTVICPNVLEHVYDDERALAYMHSVLAPGGRLVLLVPAFQFLYGSVDRSIQHHRRYTKKNLLPKVRQAQFKVEAAFYMNAIGMAGWFWNNRIMKITEENPAQIGFFDAFIAPWAERLERVFPPPFGLSLIVIGRREAL